MSWCATPVAAQGASWHRYKATLDCVWTTTVTGTGASEVEQWHSCPQEGRNEYAGNYQPVSLTSIPHWDDGTTPGPGNHFQTCKGREGDKESRINTGASHICPTWWLSTVEWLAWEGRAVGLPLISAEKPKIMGWMRWERGRWKSVRKSAQWMLCQWHPPKVGGQL